MLFHVLDLYDFPPFFIFLIKYNTVTWAVIFEPAPMAQWLMCC